MADAQMQEPVEEATEQAPVYGQGGVPKGAKTSEYYKVHQIPDRFDNPGKTYNPGNPVFSCTMEPSDPLVIPQQPEDDWFQGYESKKVNPMYRTSNQLYGANPPSVHTMPTSFHAKSQKFSLHLGTCGMYRNHSLNCASDKSVVPDH